MLEKVIRYCDCTIEICLYLLVFCLPFTIAGVETFVWTAISLWIIKRLLGYRAQGKLGLLPSTELNKAIVIFVIVNALAVLMSCNLGLSIRAFFGKILKFVILYFIVAETINDKKRLRNILLVMIISASLMVADAGVQYFSGKDFLRRYSAGLLRGYPPRLQASFVSANDFAGWLLIIIPVILSITFSKILEAKVLKIFSGFLSFILLIFLFLTYSRSALFGFLISFLYFTLLAIRLSNLRQKCVVGFIVTIILLSSFFITPLSIKQRIETLRYPGMYQTRLKQWQGALNIIEDFPLLGAGLNTYTYVIRHYKSWEEGAYYPHNSFLHMAAETGIVGLLSFLWLIIKFFSIGIRTLKVKKDPLLLGLMSGILAFLVQSFFDTNLYALQLVVLFWFMTGFTIAVIRLETVTPK